MSILGITPNIIEPSSSIDEISSNGSFINSPYTLTGWAYGFNTMSNSAIVTGDNKTFVFYFADDFDIWGVVLDKATGIWGNPVMVADGHTADDVHQYPAVVIDGSGYFHIFYGCHYSPIYYKKSTNPYDISAWNGEVTIADYATYPQTFINSSGTLYLFYREGLNNTTSLGRYIRFRTSDDDGATWSAATTIIDSNANNFWTYLGVVGLGTDDSLHLAFTWRQYVASVNDPQYFTGVHYAKSIDGGTTWLKSNDDVYSLPIVPATADAIVTGSYVFSCQANIDSNNVPKVIFVEASPNFYWTRNTIHFASLSGTVWVDTEMVGQNYDMNAHIVISGSSFFIFDSQIVNGTYEIMCLRSNDAGNVWEQKQITKNSSLNNIQMATKYNISDGIEIAWSEVGRIKYAGHNYISDRM